MLALIINATLCTGFCLFEHSQTSGYSRNNLLLLIQPADSACLLLSACCPVHALLFAAILQVGKHLGDVSNLLPLRCVCKEWREVSTLGAVEATLDLEPRLKEPSNSSSKKEQLFFKACPRLQKLTYHVSPWVSLAQVSHPAPALCWCLLAVCLVPALRAAVLLLLVLAVALSSTRLTPCANRCAAEAV